MRIVFISSGLMAEGGGAPVSESGLAKTLATTEDVVILCHRNRYRTAFVERQGVRQLLFTYRAKHVWQLAFGVGPLAGVFSSGDVFHINGHWRWENAVFGWVAFHLKKPYFLHPRGMMAVAHRSIWKKRIFNWVLGNPLMKNAAAVIALSRFECSHFINKPIVSDRVSVIPNGVEVETDALGESLPYSPDIILYIGRLEARKNLLFLVSAYGQYLQLGGTKPLILMGPVERDYDQKVRAKAVELGVSEMVHVAPADYGYHKYMRIRSAVAVIYPAIDEAFGRVSFEALASGVLPIVPRQSGSYEYLEPFFSDYSYTENDLVQLAHLIYRQEVNPVGRDRIEKAQNWLKAELNWRTIANQVITLYKHALEDEHQRSQTEGPPRGSLPELRV